MNRCWNFGKKDDIKYGYHDWYVRVRVRKVSVDEIRMNDDYVPKKIK